MSLFFKLIVVIIGLILTFSDILADDLFTNQLVEAQSKYVHYNRQLLNETEEENCTPAAINEFPDDGFTREQRKSGWITIHVLLTSYCFIILSIVCDDYFVPGIQTLVKRLQLSEDVAGASFMAITSASPELFINCVGTFITEGDLGVGTVVGSNVFNILAAPACCGLFAKMAFQFDWWSIVRDGFMYAISVIMLIATLSDDRVHWYEALAFVLAYIIYIGVLYFDKVIHKRVHSCSKPSRRSSIDHKLETVQENKEKLYPNDNHVRKELLSPLIIDQPQQTCNSVTTVDEGSAHVTNHSKIQTIYQKKNQKNLKLKIYQVSGFFQVMYHCIKNFGGS